MSIERFFVRDVTIVHPALVATYGDGVRDDFVAPTLDTTRGWLHQLTESELVATNRNGETSTHVLRVPEGTNVIASDRIIIDGQTFDIEGPPSSVWRPGGEHHIRVPLRLVNG